MKQYDNDTVHKIHTSGYTFRFASRSGNVPADEKVLCELISISSKRVDAKVFGPTREIALERAADKAKAITPSLSPDAMLAQMAKMQAKIDELENGSKPAPEPTEPDDETDEALEIAERAAGDLSKDEIAAKLVAAGMEYDKRLGRDKLAQVAFEADLL